MLVQSVPLSEPISTVTADVRLLPGMCSHVPLTQVVEREPHPALLALVPLDAGVDHAVPRKRPIQPEPSSARHARVPLLHRVDGSVLRESLPRPETFSARFTLERSLTGMHAEVEPETPGVDKRPAADTAIVVVSGCVQGRVGVQCLRGREGVSTFVTAVLLH